MMRSYNRVEKFPHILAIATQGAGGNDEKRLRELLRNIPASFFPFDRQKKIQSFWQLLQTILQERPQLVVMEGTGVAGGCALLIGRLLKQVQYVVGSGDAVGPFVASQYPALEPFFNLYERLLYRHSTGMIAWTPYLAGRALTLGTPRAVTAAGWAPYQLTEQERVGSRQRIRKALGIPNEAIVLGIAGSLAWTRRVGYCYGYELIQAGLRVNRPEIKVLIVGDGEGLARLKYLAGQRLNNVVFFTGQVPREEVPAYLAAMDIASLPQSVDKVGSFRYTTKLSEYLAVGLPIVTGQLPLAYDLNSDWLWRLPGKAPWDENYIRALTNLANTVTLSDILAKKANVPHRHHEFDKDRQVARVTNFLSDLLHDLGRGS